MATSPSPLHEDISRSSCCSPPSSSIVCTCPLVLQAPSSQCRISCEIHATCPNPIFASKSHRRGPVQFSTVRSRWHLQPSLRSQKHQYCCHQLSPNSTVTSGSITMPSSLATVSTLTAFMMTPKTHCKSKFDRHWFLVGSLSRMDAGSIHKKTDHHHTQIFKF